MNDCQVEVSSQRKETLLLRKPGLEGLVGLLLFTHLLQDQQIRGVHQQASLSVILWKREKSVKKTLKSVKKSVHTQASLL